MHITADDLPSPKNSQNSGAPLFSRTEPSTTARSTSDDELAQAIGTIIGEERSETDAKIEALNAKIARLETAMGEFTFKGAWVEGQEYKRGNFVSVGGSIFFCSSDTRSKPTNGGDWALAVPRARDGRDGKDLR
jgi:hypothetical protein